LVDPQPLSQSVTPKGEVDKSLFELIV